MMLFTEDLVQNNVRFVMKHTTAGIQSRLFYMFRKLCIQKTSKLPTEIEPVSPDCRFRYFTTSHRASDSNTMSTRDLVPILYMCPLY
jgi:hypothetical protein